MSTAPEHPGSAVASEQGVIHDIGYRHYDGPRLGRGAIWRAMFLEGLRGAYGLGRSARSKVVPALLLAAICLPALIIVIVASVTRASRLPLDYTAYPLNLQVLVVIFVAAQAPVLVSRDLRFRVISLYFSRPMERVDYVLARWAGLAGAVLFLLALPLTVLLAGALLSQMPLGEQVGDYLRALGQAALLAVLLSGIALVIAAVTPRRGLGVAAIVTVLLVLSGVQATVESIAGNEGEGTLAGYSRLLSPSTLVAAVSDDVLGGGTGVGPPDAIGTSVEVLVYLAAVAACYGLLVLRYRKVSVS